MCLQYCFILLQDSQCEYFICSHLCDLELLKLSVSEIVQTEEDAVEQTANLSGTVVALSEAPEAMFRMSDEDRKRYMEYRSLKARENSLALHQALQREYELHPREPLRGGDEVSNIGAKL